MWQTRGRGGEGEAEAEGGEWSRADALFGAAVGRRCRSPENGGGGRREAARGRLRDGDVVTPEAPTGEDTGPAERWMRL